MEPPLISCILPSRLISLDHFIRPKEHFRWNRDAELLGRLEIYHQLKLRWLLYWKVTGLRALEDLVYVSGYSAGQMLTIRAVGHEPTCLHKSTPRVYRRQPSLGSELTDPCWSWMSSGETK